MTEPMFFEITLNDQSDACIDLFERSVQMCAELQQCYAISCGTDYLLVISGATFDEFTRVHRKVLTQLPGMKKIRSAFALRSVKRYGYMEKRSTQ
jgi:Lrp/AsnC family transcriptional regulator, leucine-responsive regulatory protein